MVAKSAIKIQKDGVKKLIINPLFDTQFARVLKFGIEQFGAKVTYDFYINVMNMISVLPQMPDIHPKNRFIESSEKKVYRNILVEKYAVLYSVTPRTIRVFTIYHMSIDPEKIAKFK